MENSLLHSRLCDRWKARLAIPAAQQLRSLSILVKLLASLALSGAVLTGQPNGPLEITAIRQAVMQGTTHVVIEFSGAFEYKSNQLHTPERIYFDFPKAKPQTGLRSSYSKEFADETISRVRVAESTPGMTRVVLDLLQQVDVSTAKLQNPARLIIYLRPTPASTLQIRTSIPPPGDGPGPAPGQGATPLLKPMNLELASGTESAPAQAQPGLSHRHALKLSPVSAVPGSVAAVRLELDSPAGEEPVALQWELFYPSPKLGIEDGDLIVGSVAGSAGKSLVCAGRVESAAVYVYRCILAGGLKRIPNGAVAVINFRVRSHAQPGPATVRIANALAVAMDTKEVPIQPTEADVTIR
jgi:hypothetical protein